MDATEWEQRFEESVGRERSLMIDLLDAARGLSGAFRPPGVDDEAAASQFAAKLDAWREAVTAVVDLSERRLEGR